MYKKILIVCILLIVFAFNSKSQSLTDRATEAKLKIMIKSAEFLVSDTSGGKKIREAFCQSCKDYASIKKYIKANEVKGGAVLIDQWISWKIDILEEFKAKGSLQEFAQKVDSSLTDKHPERKNLVNYNPYQSEIAAINTEFAQTAFPNTSAGSPTQETRPADEKGDQEQEVVVEKPWYESENITVIELVIIILLMGYIVFRIRTGDKSSKKVRADLERVRKERDGLKTDIEILSRDYREIKHLREEEKAKLVRENDELAELVAKYTYLETPVTNVMEWDKPQPPRKIQENFYSRYADLVDGFSVAELLNQEGNDTIFEITVLSSNRATFKVSTNPAAQRFALSNADYFLEPTCLYDVTPFGTIVNEKPGELALVGGKWEITQQARISFK